MDYKKKYREAQKWIESIYSELSHEQQMEAEAFFPELEESKDERIRKEIIAFIKKRDRSGCDYDYDQWLAWLEKQGEQKAVDSSQTCKMETLMTLDKAIEHCKEKSCDDTACGKEHKQLAEWLTELKGYRCSVTQEAHKPADKVEPK